MYVRMVIGEAISEDQLREFSQILKEEVLAGMKEQLGFQRGDFMIEDGGNMAVFSTHWDTRDNCLLYHSSPSYRQFVAKTQHLLVGNFVVKLFRME